MSNKNLETVRRKIDKVDLKLLNLFKQRTKLVEKVIRLKKFKKLIVDHKRIKKVLARIRKSSIKRNIDPRITNKIWKTIIKSYIDFETRNFKKR